MDGIGFALLGLMKLIPDGKRAQWYNEAALRNLHPERFREDLTMLFELLEETGSAGNCGKTAATHAARANEMPKKSQATGKTMLMCQE